MNALYKAQSAYRNTDRTIRTDRSIEYDAFARVTSRLKQISEDPEDFQRLAAAVHDNRKLWSVLSADVAGKANRLSPDLRARIVYLSEFTRIYSSRVLNGASAEPLIDINTAVMRGLRSGSATT